MSYPIIPLPKADWQGAILPIGYTTWEYYDVAMLREHEGFELIGLDRICYTNHDLQRREVRLEFGWIPEESEE